VTEITRSAEQQSVDDLWAGNLYPYSLHLGLSSRPERHQDSSPFTESLARSGGIPTESPQPCGFKAFSRDSQWQRWRARRDRCWWADVFCKRAGWPGQIYGKNSLAQHAGGMGSFHSAP